MEATLERDKLKAEVRAPQRTNDEPWWQRQGTLGILGALAALGGLAWTIIQQRREFSRQREADRDAGEREQQARLDGLFADLAISDAADQPATRLAATASIESFMHPKRKSTGSTGEPWTPSGSGVRGCPG